MRVEILRTNGEREIMDLKRGDLATIKKLIGCDTIDTVLLKDRKHVMIVDDDGYDTELVDHGMQPDPLTGTPIQTWENKCVRARKPVNEEATKLYHQKIGLETDHAIVGDVAIVLDRDFA